MGRQQGDEEHSQDMDQQTQDESWDPQDLQDLGPFDEDEPSGQQEGGEENPAKPGGRQAS